LVLELSGLVQDYQKKVDEALAANLSAPNYWNPLDSKYQTDTGKEGVPFFTLAIITLIAFLLFFIIRIVCCTCFHKVRSS
jgi:hypothetical protein